MPDAPPDTTSPATPALHPASPAAPALTLVVPASLPAATARRLEASAFGPFRLLPADDAPAAMALAREGGVDAVLLDAGIGALDPDDAIAPELMKLAADVATLLIVDAATPQQSVLAWQRGLQELVSPAGLAADTLPARVRAAIERKHHEREARHAYATDLETGLPHQQQLIEHMSHLIALRERQPSPMALLVLRVEGLSTTRARFGDAAAQVLRRKIAVRLRAGVRASDVVAALADDSFAVLLGALLVGADAQRVGEKLQAAMLEPFRVAGSDVAVATALGIGQYPDDGAQPDALLRRAVGLAASTQARGRSGHANFGEAGTTPAANDE